MVTRYEYDNGNRVLVETQSNFGVAANAPVPEATQYTTTYAYDQDNKLTQKTDPPAVTTCLHLQPLEPTRRHR